MNKHLKLFANHSAYSQAESNLDKPNVTVCQQEGDVHFNPYVAPPFFCKLTLDDGSIVEIDGEGDLQSSMVAEYSATCVGVEVGEKCTSIGYSGGVAFGPNFQKLTTVIISNSVSQIPVDFRTSSLESVTINRTTPPFIIDEAFTYSLDSWNTRVIPTNLQIYVPAESVNTYKTQQYWNKFSNRIQAIS